MIGKRARSIILEIIKRGEVKISDLAEQYHVSERTIRSDLEEIDYFLRENNCSAMMEKNRGTVAIKRDSNVTMLIYQMINESKVVTASYSPDERLLEIFYFLVTAKEPVKLENLAEHLLVSKSTVVKDLDRLKAIYQSYDLQFQGNHEGMEISGKEEIIRRELVKRFIRTMDKHAVMDLTNLIIHKEKITYKVFWRLFEEVDLDAVRSCIELLKTGLGMQLSDLEYLNLMGHFCILLKRAKLGKCPDREEQHKPSPLMGFLTENIYDCLSKMTRLHQNEKQYIRYIIYLSSSSLYLMEQPMPEGEAEENVQRCMRALGCEGNAYIRQGLRQEFSLLYWERQLGVPCSHPVVELADEAFLQVYEKIDPLFSDEQMTRDEKWRIAAHFIAGTEYSDQKGHKRVLVVSDKPSTFINLLIDQIVPMFDIEIVGITGLAQLEKYRKVVPVDCLLSTIHLRMEGVEVVEVHPLLTLKDIGVLEEHFFLRRLPPRRYSGEDDEKIEERVLWVEEEVEYCSQRVAHELSQALLLADACTLPLEKSIEDAMQKQRLPFIVGKTQVLNNRNYNTVKRNQVVGCRIKGQAAIESVILISVSSPEIYLKRISSLLIGGAAWMK